MASKGKQVSESEDISEDDDEDIQRQQQSYGLENQKSIGQPIGSGLVSASEALKEKMNVEADFSNDFDQPTQSMPNQAQK